MNNPIVALVKSRKFILLALCIIGVFVMVAMGRTTDDKALEFIKWMVSTWMLAQAAEDGAAKLGARMTTVNNTVVTPEA